MKRVINLRERHSVGDHLIDINYPLHVPVDNLGDVRSASRTTERGAAPRPSGHELEGTRGNFLPRAGHTNDASRTLHTRPLNHIETDPAEPNTVTVEPASTFIVNATAPIPVVTPQPM
jgi:hypothetical protein